MTLFPEAPRDIPSLSDDELAEEIMEQVRAARSAGQGSDRMRAVIREIRSRPSMADLAKSMRHFK